MLTGRIRLHETRELTVEAPSVDEARAQIEAQVPDGWVLTDAPVTMAKASVMVTMRAVMARRDVVDEIDADDMAALRAKVPENWDLLSVRAD